MSDCPSTPRRHRKPHAKSVRTPPPAVSSHSFLSPTSKATGATTDSLTFLQSAIDRDEPVRFGKWSSAEEAYLDKLVTLFRQGLLAGVKPRTSMRSWLAQMLNCCPMRISKKQTHGHGFQGKHKFERNKAKQERLTQDAYDCKARELWTLRSDFLRAWAKEEFERRGLHVSALGFQLWFDKAQTMLPVPTIARNERVQEYKKRPEAESAEQLWQELTGNNKRHRTVHHEPREVRAKLGMETKTKLKVQLKTKPEKKKAANHRKEPKHTTDEDVLTPALIQPGVATMVKVSSAPAATPSPAPLTPAPITCSPPIIALDPAPIPSSPPAITLNAAPTASSTTTTALTPAVIPSNSAPRNSFGDAEILGDWLSTSPSRGLNSQWADLQTLSLISGEARYAIREDTVQFSVMRGDQQNPTGMSMVRRSSRVLIDFGAPSSWLFGDESKRLSMSDLSPWSDHDLVNDLAMMADSGVLGWEDAPGTTSSPL